MGILAQVDQTSLALYCDAFSRYMKARRKVNREGLTVLGTGGPKKHPGLTVMREAYQQMQSLASSFGFTPTSRDSLGVGTEQPAPEKDDEGFLFGS